jgi:uncharacterized protein (TIRG00374 family)
MADPTIGRGRRLRRWLRWLLPLGLLVSVLATVDLALFLDALARTNPWVAVAGVLLVPARNVFAALRWQMLLRFGLGRRPGVAWTFGQYWIGLTLGFFTPSSAGLDVYRVAAAVRRFGRLALNVTLVFAEKALALVSCTLLVLAVAPLAPGVRDDDGGLVEQLWLGAAGLLVITLVALAVSVLVLRSTLADRLMTATHRRLVRFSNRIRRTTSVNEPAPPVDWKRLLVPLLRPGRLGALLGASLAIQVVTAFGNDVMFRAAGHSVPFAAHLFVVPVLYILFALPISFGSLGVREAAFIVLYGLFGVPRELALLVSVLNLAGILLNNVIGAGVMVTYGRHDKLLAPAVSHQPGSRTAGDVAGGDEA